MFDFLTTRLSALFSRITGKGSLSDADITTLFAEIEESLIQADVPRAVTVDFLQSIRREIDQKKIPTALRSSDYLIKLVYDKLVLLLGGTQPEFSFQIPSTTLIVGLQGSGKTTTLAKLAYWINAQAAKRGKNRRILVASLDFNRPAAIDQLEIVATKAGASFYRTQSKNALEAAQEISDYYKKERYELLLVDTAGRLHIDQPLIAELVAIKKLLNPRYTFLALDAMTGQESLEVAKQFDIMVGFDQLILTKMDSAARAGAALACRSVLKKDIVFVGMGEHLDDLNRFYADRVASSIIGMGDLQTLIERAEEKIKHSEQKEADDSLFSGALTLETFARQLEMLNKIGPLSQLIKYIPGIATASLSAADIERGQMEMKRFRALIGSMTPKERKVPRIIDESRKKRIAKGAGSSVADLTSLLNRFEQAKQYFEQAKQYDKLMKKGGYRGDSRFKDLLK